MQRDSILRMDYAHGLDHSQKVTNRQVLSEAVEASMWTFVDATKMQGCTLLEKLPHYRVVCLITCAAHHILNSAESTDVIARACMNQGSTLNHLIQVYWPEDVVWY